MQSGITTTAAGRPTPGPSPSFAPTTILTSSRTPPLTNPISNRPWRRQSCLRVRRAPCVAPSNKRLAATTHPATHHFAISNRHLVRLEFAVSRPESATSLFLIDPSCPHFTRAFSLTSPTTGALTRPFPSTHGTFAARPAYLHPTGNFPSGGFE